MSYRLTLVPHMNNEWLCEVLKRGKVIWSGWFTEEETAASFIDIKFRRPMKFR